MKKELGQFFTTSELLQKKVKSLVRNTTGKVLEPSFGAGHLLLGFETRDIICFEIDNSIKPVLDISKFDVHYEDFLKYNFQNQTFSTVIANPPYVKTSHLKFIEKCFHLLEKGGEMIFIVPSDFLKLTHAKNMIKQMDMSGMFTDFYFPDNEKLFDNASVDIVVFRYQKKNYTVVDGMISFSNTKGVHVKDLFDVYVGIVSGKDSVFKSETLGNIELLDNGKFILVEKFPCGDENVDEHLLKHKEDLLNRKIRKFNEKNWFEWGALRNKKVVDENRGRECIYIKTITRNSKVAFKGSVMYFGGNFLCMIPKRNDINLDKIIEFLNSESFRREFTFSGRFKIGHGQLTNSFVNVF